jgi:Right handed beta helix region
MNKFRFTIKLVAIAIFMLAFASMTQAQASRTWVSGVGDDANPCSRTAPCKTFAGAISKTLTAGEISVLDPGGFGALTITKAITVNGEGTLAGVLNASVPGFIVNAPTTDNVTIRNVSINAPNNGTDGIRILAAKNVNIENVTINGQANEGIDISATNNVNVAVNNTQIKNCATVGIQVGTTSGLAKVTLDHVSVTNCATGIKGRSNSRISMTECIVAFNGTGVLSESQTAAVFAVINIEHSQITQNSGAGVQAGGGVAVAGSFARISDNQITNNGTSGALVGANGTIETFMNNEIKGNSTDGCVGCINVSGNFN